MGRLFEVDDTGIKGAVAALITAEKDLRAEVSRVSRQNLPKIWRAQITERVLTEQAQAVYLRGAKPNVTTGNPPVMTAATSRRPLSGGRLKNNRPRRAGLVPGTDWPYIEFGSPKAHGSRGQLPQHNPSGRIAYAALAETAPVLVSMWLGVIYDVYRTWGEDRSYG